MGEATREGSQPGRPLQVLALAAVPMEAAATRYRLHQFVEPLARHGIQLRIEAFLDARTFSRLYDRSAFKETSVGVLRGLLGALGRLIRPGCADVLLVQREALLFGPPVLEWLMLRLNHCPLVLDLDDATYVRYVSPTYPRLGRLMKWPSKTDTLIRWASVVTCGNETIAAHVSKVGTPAVVLPTTVDMTLFRPRETGTDGPVVLGWVGSHSTYPYLAALAPVLRELAQHSEFRLKIVGSGQAAPEFDGVDVDVLDWELSRDVADFQSFDIGLYPIIEDEWSVGKSGLKAIQYMAVGVPYVASSVGAASAIGEPGVTHFCASTPDDWQLALRRLIDDAALRRTMGEAGRRHVVENYGVDNVARVLAGALESASRGRTA